MAKKSPYVVRRNCFGKIRIAFTGNCSYNAQEEELREAGKVYESMIGRHEVLTGQEWIERIVQSVAPSKQRDTHIRAIQTLMC